MRIRTIKPEWLEDDRLVQCSDAGRVLSVALITMADDEGRGRLGLTTAARIWPNEPKKLQSAIKELNGWFVLVYEVRGQKYYQIRNWLKHQRINRPSESKLPQFTEDSLKPHGALTEDSLTERKGREGKGSGKDRQLTGSQEGSPVQQVFDCWKELHCSRPGQAVLNPKRKARIQGLLKQGYSADRLCAALKGALSDDWIMGRAPKSEKAYRDLETILRDGSQVEKFEAMDGKRQKAHWAPRSNDEFKDSDISGLFGGSSC